MSPFSRQSGHIRKKIFVMSHVNIIIGHFYHLYVYMSHLAVSEGLFCHRFVYMSHVAATAGHFAILSPICPTSLCTGIFFDLYPLYVPSDSFSRFFMQNRNVSQGKSVYLFVSITKIREIHKSMYYRLRRLFVFRHHPQSVFRSHPYDNFSS